MSWRRVLRLGLALLGVVVGAVLLAGWGLDRMLVRAFGSGAPDAAITVATREYGRMTGLQHVEVVRSIGWDDCAVVEVQDGVAGRLGAVTVYREGGRWRLGRTTNDGTAQFDVDDLLGNGRQQCLAIAHSTGEVANGAMING